MLAIIHFSSVEMTRTATRLAAAEITPAPAAFSSSWSAIPRNPNPSQIQAQTTGAFSPMPPANTSVPTHTTAAARSASLCDCFLGRFEMAPSLPPRSTPTWKSRPSQCPAVVQKKVKRTGAFCPAGTRMSANSWPVPMDAEPVSWACFHSSQVQCNRNGEAAWIRRVAPAGSERTCRPPTFKCGDSNAKSRNFASNS